MRTIILLLLVLVVVSSEEEEQDPFEDKELPLMIEEMDKEFDKWFKQMEVDMKKFDEEFFDMVKDSNFDMAMDDCGFKVEWAGSEAQLVTGEKSFEDIRWRVSRIYVYPDHAIPEFFFGFEEDLQFQMEYCTESAEEGRRVLMGGLDDLINNAVSDDLSNELMNQMAGDDADLASLLDMIAKNGNDEDYEKQLKDLELLLSSQKEWENLDEEEFRELLVAQGKNKSEIEVMMEQFRQQKEDAELQNQPDTKGANFEVIDGNLIVNGTFYEDIKMNRMRVKQLDQFLRNYEIQSSFIDSVQDSIDQNLSYADLQDFAFLPRGYGYILSAGFVHDGQQCGVSTHFHHSFNVRQPVKQLPHFQLKVHDWHSLCLDPGHSYSLDLLDSLDENVSEQSIEIGPAYAFGTDNECILSKSWLIKGMIYDGTFHFQLPQNNQQNQAIYVKYTKITDSTHYIGLAMLQMQKSYVEDSLSSSISGMALESREDVEKLIQVVGLYQAEKMTLGEEQDNVNANLIQNYCGTELMVSYSNPVPISDCMPDLKCNEGQGKCEKAQDETQLYHCTCNDENKNRNGVFCEFKTADWDTLQAHVKTILEANIGSIDDKVGYLSKLFWYGLITESSVAPTLSLLQKGIQDIYFTSTYKTLFSLLASLVQYYPAESATIYPMVTQAVLHFAAKADFDTELKTDDIFIKVLTGHQDSIQIGGFLYGNSMTSDIYFGAVHISSQQPTYTKMVLAVADCKIANCLVGTQVIFRLLDDKNNAVPFSGDIYYQIPLVQKSKSLQFANLLDYAHDELIMEQVIDGKKKNCEVSEIKFGSLLGLCKQLSDVSILALMLKVDEASLYAGLPEYDPTQETQEDEDVDSETTAMILAGCFLLLSI